MQRKGSDSSINSNDFTENQFEEAQQQINDCDQDPFIFNQRVRKPLMSETRARELEEKIEEYQISTLEQETVDHDAQMQDLINSIYLNILPKQNQIQTQEYKQILPVVLQIKSMKSLLKKQRSNIDLICVIDVSGSMEGEKIKQVQNSLRYIQKILKPTDRIALVSFATNAGINLQWTRNIAENKWIIKKAIKSIKIRDTTNIVSGVALGLRMIKNRKYKNPVTCMFVLSDGVDDDAFADLRCKDALQYYNIQETLTINTFGYGSNHDARVMNNVANLKGGQFVYIDEIERVSEHFILSMSGMISVKAKNVTLRVRLLNNDFKIAKIFGDDFLWNKIDENEFQLSLNYLGEEENKEFAMEIEIPSFKQQELIQEKILQVDLQGAFIRINNDFKKTQYLLLEFTKKEVQFQPVELIEVNYLRAKAGDRIGLAKGLTNNKKYDQAIQLLNQIIDEIESSLFKGNKQLINVLKDLNHIKTICKPKIYEKNAEATFLHKYKNHIQRQRSINNSDEWCQDEEEQMNEYRNGNLNLSDSDDDNSKIVGNFNQQVFQNKSLSGSINQQIENYKEEDSFSSPKNIQKSNSSLSGSCDTCRKCPKRKYSQSSSLS